MRKRLANFGSELIYMSLIIPLLLLEALAQSLDVVSTWAAISFFGAREGNPVLAWFVNSSWRGRWAILWAMKARLLANEKNYYFRTKNNKWARYYNVRGAIFVCIITWCVVTWNLSVIFRRRHALRA